jgi:predicted ribosome quality control (RQC) complex YloA/Tae2 family protein
MKTESIYIQKLNCSITYSIGQNAYDNDDIISAANPEDLWFHVNNKPSCHIIASVPENVKRKDLKYIVNQGAVLCKKHSYPSEKNLEIIFTRIKYIERTDIPGKVNISGNSSIKVI